MDIDKFKNSQAGKVMKTEKDYWAFVPNSLPPLITYNKDIVGLLSEADRQLGNLSGVGALLPNPYLLITPYAKREAVLSSKIEGTQTSLSDLFYFEAANKEGRQKEAKKTDVLEVINYVKAMNYGIKTLKKLPLCLRLIREIHKELMRGVRGERLTPGDFRRSQNWIGPSGCTLNEATYVPPPVHEMKEALGDLEKFLHDRESFPGLIQCALIHYQFEAIHPFLDGNGRIGRLLITLFLCEREYLVYPMLYLSAFFEKYRNEYYARLLAVSEKGEWEEWIKFFLRAVAAQAKDAVDNSKAILNLLDKYRKIIQKQKGSTYTLKLLEEIFLNPFVTIPYVAKKLGTTYPTAKAAVERLKKVKILFEASEKQWGKVYCAKELLGLLEGTKKK
ncbi:MAG: Fic family protein [Candidatus Omnitrophica bacterium]|nr:Fic family protein [Candidatus Omnitrophota bacterium]